MIKNQETATRRQTNRCDQVEVYTTRKNIHYEGDENENVEENESILVYAGKVIDPEILHNELKTQLIRPNPTHFTIQG